MSTPRALWLCPLTSVKTVPVPPNVVSDTTFGGTGTVFTDVSGQSHKARGVLIQPDGKILVGGTGGDGPHYFFVLARYNPNGSLDPTFGNGGKIVTDPSPN